jgi:hypothetical protein
LWRLRHTGKLCAGKSREITQHKHPRGRRASVSSAAFLG